jgi:chromosome segregation ATPase
VDAADLKRAVTRIEARQEQDASDRQELREQALDFRRRLEDLEERVQEIERRLPRD